MAGDPLAKETMRYAMFVLLDATPAWLSLSRTERASFNRTELADVFRAYPDVHVRHFDAEAFTGRCSDVVLFETDDLSRYSFLMDALRDSPVFAKPYFRVVDVITTVEDGYRAYDAHLAVAPIGGRDQ